MRFVLFALVASLAAIFLAPFVAQAARWGSVKFEEAWENKPEEVEEDKPPPEDK